MAILRHHTSGCLLPRLRFTSLAANSVRRKHGILMDPFPARLSHFHQSPVRAILFPMQPTRHLQRHEPHPKSGRTEPPLSLAAQQRRPIEFGGASRASRPGWFLLALLLALPGLRAADRASAPPERFTEHRDARDGRLLFLRNDALQPTTAQIRTRGQASLPATLPMLRAAELAQPEWTNSVAVARRFLAVHALAFGEAQPEENLAALGAQRDELGLTHVRFQQTYRGLPVFGTELIVHLTLDQQVSSVGGGLVPGLQVPVDPLLTVEAATLIARHLWQTEFQLQVDPEVRSTRLCVIAPGMLRNDGDPTPRLVWEIKLVNGCTECPASRFPEDYYVDARTADLRFQHTGIRRLNRRVQDCTTYPTLGFCSSNWTNPVTGYHHGRREGEGSWGPNPIYNACDVDTVYDHLGNLHGWLAVVFGRDGVNARGGLGNGVGVAWQFTVAQVYLDQYPPSTASCPTAVFDGTQGVVAFCYNTLVPDVVGHEYMHGLPYYSHFDGSGNAVGMVYSGQSGALNESQSDVWGELYQKYLTRTNDWISWPEDSVGRARNLSDPPSSTYPIGAQRYPWPDRFQSAYVYCGTLDESGVHYNSTIVSKACYLLAEGGFFNGCTIRGLGTDKLEQILYRAVTQYYSTSATFNEAYADLIQAATDLYGAGSDEVRQTTRALQAVELDQPGYCSGIPARAPAATDVPPGPLTVTSAETNLVLSWPPVPWLAGEPVLLATTNLTTGPWTALTAPLTTNTVTVPTTGAEQYFRLRIP